MAAATIEQRETAMRTARAQLASAQNALSVAEADRKSRDGERRELSVKLAQTEVKAPVGGIVSRRTARLGAAAGGAGEPLFRIIKDGAIDLEAEAPEQALPRLAVGMSAELALPGVADKVAGTVRLIGAEVDKASRTGKVRIALDPGARAHIGGFASAEITLTRSQGVGVPASAVARDATGARALVVRDGVVEQRKVTVGVAEGDARRDRRRRQRRRDGGGARRRLPASRRPGDRRTRGNGGSDAMRLNVSAWSIRRPIPAAVAFVILTLLGIVSFRQMAVTRFPNIDIPIVQVAVTQSGAAPSELESQVTKKVEDAVSNVPGVWHMISTVTDGSSVTWCSSPSARSTSTARSTTSRIRSPRSAPTCRAPSTSRSSAASRPKACRSSPTPLRRPA